MRIAHVGPRLARRGGPAGYLWQLAAAAEEGHDRHSICAVTFPERQPASPVAPNSYADRTKAVLRRVKRALAGPPTFYRPSDKDVRREGGAVDTLLSTSVQSICLEAADSIPAALRSADVLFAHEAAVAEQLLAARHAGQQVWLMMHSPLPVALEFTWCWCVPERPWTEIAGFPDVARWIRWELDICSRVDRLIAPCPEASAELTRVDERFAALSFEYVLSGASGPTSAFPDATVAELRRRWRLPTDVPVGLFLGSSLPYRGLDALAEAAAALPSAVRGIVAVAGPAKHKVSRHRRLRALGPVREISDLLRAVDFVVNVNRFSLFDLSTIEAAEAGRAMLLHATGGNLRFEKLGIGCVMLPDLERHTIAAGLAKLFEMPASRRQMLGEASRACYERHLTRAHLWSNHIALYDGAARRQPAASLV